MVPAAPPAAHAAAPPPPAALLPHQAVKARYPHCLVQFEDFATEKAFKILAHMRDKCAMGGGVGGGCTGIHTGRVGWARWKRAPPRHQSARTRRCSPTPGPNPHPLCRLLCFNDDIQGTGAVVCAGVLNGLRCQGTPAADARIVFYGAGSSAVGVAETIAAAVAADAGIPVAQARTAIWMVDSKGLITTTRGDALAPHKVAFARTDGAPDMKQARGRGGWGGCVWGRAGGGLARANPNTRRSRRSIDTNRTHAYHLIAVARDNRPRAPPRPDRPVGCWWRVQRGERWGEVVVGAWGHLAHAANLLDRALARMYVALPTLQPKNPTKKTSQADIVELCKHHPRPLVFPLSNPTSCAEVTAEDAVKWSGGAALFASGSPFPDVKIDGKAVRMGQANNVFVFPGVGFGSVMAKASAVSDGMLLAAARAVAASVPAADVAAGTLYPPISDLRRVSLAVSTAVAEAAWGEGLAAAARPPDVRSYIAARMWWPDGKKAGTGGCKAIAAAK